MSFRLVPSNMVFKAETIESVRRRFSERAPDTVTKQYFYSTRTDTLYSRENVHTPWVIECSGNCNHTCPVKFPDAFSFEMIGIMKGTQLKTYFPSAVRC